MRPVAVTHDAGRDHPAISRLPHDDEGVGLGDRHLSQYSTYAFKDKFSQGMIDNVRLTEGGDSGISPRR
jgi:hypothetical protein